MIERILQPILQHSATQFPVIALIGPRQSGKTTLVKKVFPALPYVTLEDLDTRSFAKDDPRGFLANYKDGAIFDEIQRVPELFSYLQTIVDEKKQKGRFIVTGSQHFLLQENLAQTLAGRVRILTLLPLSLEEMHRKLIQFPDPESYLFHGFYPRLYDDHIDPADWYPSYVQTYVEKDVRQIKNITDLSTFQKFLRLCAGRVGQLLNLSSLALDAGISHNTAKAWISLLESSFIVFLLQPHHQNFHKRLVKMPKLYFYDTGLLCSLLRIEKQQQVDEHHLRGNLFENFIIAELLKHRFHHGRPSNLFFWRDKTGHEIDCLIEEADTLIPVEIKAGKTATQEYFQNLEYWNRLAKAASKNAFVIYAGDISQKRSSGHLLSWKELFMFFRTNYLN